MEEVAQAKSDIAEAAAEAVKVISAAAAEAVKVNARSYENTSADHDLLVELKTELKGIRSDIIEINLKLDNKYVTKEEFKSLKDKVDDTRKIVYGFCALILIAVVVALMSLVIK